MYDTLKRMVRGWIGSQKQGATDAEVRQAVQELEAREEAL